MDHELFISHQQELAAAPFELAKTDEQFEAARAELVFLESLLPNSEKKGEI